MNAGAYSFGEIVTFDVNSKQSKYWYDEFLDLKALHDNGENTERAFNYLKSKILDPVKKKSKSDYLVLWNTTVAYMRSAGEFSMGHYADNILAVYKPEENSLNMNELATATRYNIPVIEVILNNHVLGMVRQWQDLFYGQRYSATVLEDVTDFVKVSEGMGAKAYRVTDSESFDNALKEAIELNIPCVIECVIGKDEKVFPMVAPGAASSEAFDMADMQLKKN